MGLYFDLLLYELTCQDNPAFTTLLNSANAAMEGICFQALRRIKDILDQDELDDFECIEEIVKVFEKIGSEGGSRHDFG